MKPLIITTRVLFESLTKTHKGHYDNKAQYKICVAFPEKVTKGITDWLNCNIDFEKEDTATKALNKIKDVDNTKYIELESDLNKCLWFSTDFKIPVYEDAEIKNGDYIKLKFNVKEHTNKWGTSAIYTPIAIMKVKDGNRVLKDFDPFEGMQL